MDEWLEISAHPALAISLQECLAQRETKTPVRSSLRREREHESLLKTAMDLHRASMDLDFAALARGSICFRCLPTPGTKVAGGIEAPDWREGRLASGGRGLLDVRLARCDSTWIARLGNRRMARTSGTTRSRAMAIFPAAGFVELGARSRTAHLRRTAFRHRRFRRFAVRLSCRNHPRGFCWKFPTDTDSRTFSVQSRQGSAWSSHVVGSMRGERVESEFSTSTHPAGYRSSKSGCGRILHAHERPRPALRFRIPFGARAGCGQWPVGRPCDAFRSERETCRRDIRSILCCSMEALHVFSAGQATVERKGRMKLPVRFARIQFVRSPGAAAQVNAAVRTCNDELVEGDVAIYNEAGQPCVLVEGFRAIGLAAARRSGAPGGIRDLIYNVEWEHARRGDALGAPAGGPRGFAQDR